MRRGVGCVAHRAFVAQPSRRRPPYFRRTSTGADLLQALGIRQEWLMCSLIQKFGGVDEADIDVFVKGIHAHLPKGFHAKGGTVRLCG